MRDRFVHWTCNLLLNHVATKDYRKFVLVTIALGIAELEARKALEEEAKCAI